MMQAGKQIMTNDIDVDAAKARCRKFRHRILELSQQVTALHIAPAFSCLEMVDAIYHEFMRRDSSGAMIDTFMMSKGHGCLAQYVMLEDFGILSRQDMDDYCTPRGRLGAHPDYGTPGIAASTGSLGHGMGMAVGMAYADKIDANDKRLFVVLSDGEMQEGSTWEAMMMASTLKLSNLIAFLDLNDFQSLGRTSETLPGFYPIVDKIRAFGFECVEVDGHDSRAIARAIFDRQGDKPFFLVGRTTKGRGVSFMENVPIWHYRSPNAQEYQAALAEITATEGAN